MLNEKRLYIIVSDYPYGNGEPFLEDELIALAKQFEKVCLIITNPIHLNDLTHKFLVPENVELKFYIPKNNLTAKLKAVWFAFSKRQFRKSQRKISNQKMDFFLVCNLKKSHFRKLDFPSSW